MSIADRPSCHSQSRGSGSPDQPVPSQEARSAEIQPKGHGWDRMTLGLGCQIEGLGPCPGVLGSHGGLEQRRSALGIERPLWGHTGDRLEAKSPGRGRTRLS